jgi:hypothetical protein
MADSNHPNPPDPSRIMAQRNAAFAAALILTGVVICAGKALEVFPRRNAEIYRQQNAAILAGYSTLQHALSDSQSALLPTQATLRHTEDALRNTQEALRLAQRPSR